MLHAMTELNPIGKRPLERPRIHWKYVIKKYMKEMEGGSNWSNLALGREG